MPAFATLRRWFAPTNPYNGELVKLQEQLDKRTKQLQEATLLWGDSFGWPDSPMGSRFGPGEWGSGYGIYGGNRSFPYLDRSQSRDHAPLPFLTEVEWRIGVAASQDLCTRNHLAIAFQEFVGNFVGPCQVQFVLRSQAPHAVSSGPPDADGDGSPDTDPIIAACQQVWDEWCEMVDWGQGEQDREAECRSRLFRHGEAILRFFRGGPETAGLPPVRHVEPELIRTPPDAAEHQKWGVETPPNDAERELRYWVADAVDPTHGQWEESSRFVRIKANVDRSTKRGLPDLFPVAAHLRRVVGLLENMGEVAKLQAAIAWIQKYGPTASQAQVQAAISQGQDYSAIKLPAHPGATGAQTISVREHPAGSVIHAENGRIFEPGPMATGVAGFELVEKAVMRSVGLRWGCPQFFSGDGDSFASSLVTGSPFARATESRQDRMKGFTRSVAKKVLELAEAAGRLPDGTSKRVKVLVTAKPVIFADEEKQGRTFELELKNKVMDPQEWIKKRGRDPKVVAANIAAWSKKFGPPGGEPQPGGGADPFGGGIGAGLTPAPPGSAGGDGSSPLGEWRLREGQLVQKKITDKNGVRRTVWVSPEDADAVDDAPAESPADAKARTLLARIAEVPAQLRDKVTSFVKTKYAGMVSKYGKKGAAAILAATILLLPVPVPGTSLAPIAIANAIVALRNLIMGKPEESVEPELTDEQIQAAAKQLIAELYAELGEEPPDLAG